jgi:hypothetical protein
MKHPAGTYTNGTPLISSTTGVQSGSSPARMNSGVGVAIGVLVGVRVVVGVGVGVGVLVGVKVVVGVGVGVDVGRGVGVGGT